MERLPYDQVIVRAMKLLYRAIAETNESLAVIFFKEYSEYLKSCGWDDVSFDAEMLKRVDQNWVDPNIN